MKRKEAGSLLEMLKHRRSVLLVLGFTMGGSLYFYTFTTYMQKFLVNTAHMAAGTVSVVMTAVLVIYMLLQPVFGAISDRIGRRNNMLLFSALALVGSVPLLGMLDQTSSPYAAFALVMAGLVIASFYTSISGVVKAELFPSTVRASASVSPMPSGTPCSAERRSTWRCGSNRPAMRTGSAGTSQR